jgi:general secretion pathway protein G
MARGSREAAAVRPGTRTIRPAVRCARAGGRDHPGMTVESSRGGGEPTAPTEHAVPAEQPVPTAHAASTRAARKDLRAQRRQRLLALGYTLIELMVAIGILGILTAMGVSGYDQYVERARASTAVSELLDISQRIKTFELANRRLPDGLDEIGRGGALDPWGSPYEYYNLQAAKGNGQARKRKNLAPLNSDYDLYSIGKDKRSVTQLGQTESHDDIVRALDGRFLGRGDQLDPAASNQK